MRVAIVQADDAVLAADHDGVADGAGDRHIEERAYLRDVPVLVVVGQRLHVPAQSAGAQVERHQRVRVEIRARALPGVEHRCRIGHRHIDFGAVEVDRQRTPHGTAAHRRVGSVLPGLEAGFAGSRHGVEAPHRRAVGQAERTDPALDGVLAAGRADDDEVIDDQRRHREDLAGSRQRHLPGPQQMAVARIERQQIAVVGAAHDVAVPDRHAAIVRPLLLVLRRPAVAPALAAGARVDRDRQLRRRQVHRRAVHHRTGDEVLERADLVEAGDAQPRDVVGADVSERRVARAVQVVIVVRPAGARERGPKLRGARTARLRQQTALPGDEGAPAGRSAGDDRQRRIGAQRHAPGRAAVGGEQVGDDIDVVLLRQRAVGRPRHRGRDDVKEIGGGPAGAAPAGGELRAGQCRRESTLQRAAVAGGTVPGIDPLAVIALVRREGRCGRGDRRQQADERQQRRG